MRCPHCNHDTPDASPFCVACHASILRAQPITSGLAPDSSDAVTGSEPIPSFTSRFDPGVLTPGCVFGGRYRIERFLGAGGMGAVYHAWDQELGTAVALKVIRPDVVGTPELATDFDRRFKQELLLARQVTHRHVTRIHDLGNADGVRYITMQFIDGTTLSEIIRQGAVPFPRVVRFAKQLVSGIAAAHDALVIHRDLKPQNVLVDAADNLYVSDFGLAKSLESVTTVGVTRPGEFVGTPRYVSPEQIQGKPVDHRSDLYAVGLILFELSTGEPPCSATSAIELIYQRVERPASDAPLVTRAVPEYFRRIVMRCLDRDPDARYASGHEILADLEGERAAVIAPTGRTISLTTPRVTTRWKVVIAAVVLIGLIVSVPIVRRYTLALRANQVPTVATPIQKRIAVLPFKAVGDEASSSPVAVGIADALSTKLFQLPGVVVAAATAVERAGGKDSLAAIARELGTPLLVSGTVQSNGNSLRVNVTLEDTAAGRRVLAQDFSGLPADLLTLEDQIYSQLATALGLQPTSEQLARALTHPTENIEAYQLYLRGRNRMRGQQEPENVKAAIGLYEEALKLDASFAPAYAGISDGALRLYRTTKDPAWAQKALSSALQGQRLDERLLDVRLALASVYQATGKTAEAIAELTIAAELAPSSDDVFRRLGRAYLSTGRGDDAIRTYQTAIDINPYYWVSYAALGSACLQLGAYDKATDAMKKVIELEPENAGGYNDLGAVYLLVGRYDDAVDAFKRAVQLQPIAQTYTNVGIGYAYQRNYAEAISSFAKAVELNPNNELFVGNLGDGYRWAGNTKEAIATYDRAIALALKDLQVNPRDSVTRGHVALYYAKKGEGSQAQRMIANARAIDPKNVDLIYAEATIGALSGKPSEALIALDQALRAGYSMSAVQGDPDMKSLSEVARFQELLEKYRPK